MKGSQTVTIPIQIDCEMTSGWEGQKWDVQNVIDRRENWSIGDIGIYDFEPRGNFMDDLMNAVLRTLKESGEFADEETFFVVDVTVEDGGIALGTASQSHYGHQFLTRIK